MEKYRFFIIATNANFAKITTSFRILPQFPFLYAKINKKAPHGSGACKFALANF